jgi:alcohol dehydrogenase (cytochrome c)
MSKWKTRFIAAAALLTCSQLLHAQLSDFTPVSDDDLNSPEAADWLRWRGNHDANGYSPLDQVTRANVANLQLAWAWNMESGESEQEPLVHDGIMFLPHTNGKVQAIDATNGELIWEYQRRLPKGMQNASTRGLALYADRIFVTTDDAFLVALDARTGTRVWEIKTGNPEERLNYSSAPIAADSKIFAGQTCGTGTPRACALMAHDAQTGEILWRRESVAGPDDPVEHNATWGQVPHEMRRKASFWLTGSYDPELETVYWTTASPYPYPEILKGTTEGGDLLYSNSILALDANTGDIKWFFQMQPRDNFDMDHQDNPILADVEIDGVVRKVVFVLGKPGIQWAFDRQTGEYLWHKQLVSFQNLYDHIDPEIGTIRMNESLIPTKIGDNRLVCPGMRGGKLFQTDAYNPQTQTLYSPVSNECTNYEIVSLETNVSGVDYSQLFHMQDSNGMVGRLAAVSAATGELLWNYDQRAALGSVLATGGGLVFVGDLHRYFRALDAATGKVLWDIPLGSPVTGYPISYAVNGKQYIAVGVGGGSAGTRHLAQLYPELKIQHGNSMLMVFALPDK